MRSKRGQFYLIAAAVIVLVIAGFVIISNYATRKSSVTLYDLGEELGIEGQNVLDYGTHTFTDPQTFEQDMNNLWQTFIVDYKDYAGEGKDIYFIFGDSSSQGLTIVGYEDLVLMTNPPDIPTSGGKVSVTIEDVTYEFDLVSGQTFYFIVSQEIDGDKYVATNE